MGIAISLLMIAGGAIMRYAVTVQGHGFNVHTTGMILMVIGAIGAVLSIAFWASWGGVGTIARSRTTVVRGTTPVREASTTVVQERGR
jgi:hypothetical protein